MAMDEISGLGMTSAFCPTFLFQPNVYLHYFFLAVPLRCIKIRLYIVNVSQES